MCISILHPPGEDRYNEQESADERWRPILGVESIIVSVISMLSDPNDESPANIDAAVSALPCLCGGRGGRGGRGVACVVCCNVAEMNHHGSQPAHPITPTLARSRTTNPPTP